ncbi:dimethylarginine dimethylaminohydrolase family protein [Homoserinimonas sp. OAct 916]|uniref:dimethylarginine dimethylaminohydrolase family protein n=1 Tax=Homoserinimonas sp. OAct 916 TaxID=2211450 RepID=UPI000DBE24D6|nr:arginine deiminase family protein [Homoserinimonas sp. OAct 916]
MAIGEFYGPAENYFHKLLGPEAEPGFSDPEELERNWGRRWGRADETSTLRMAIVRRPNPGMADIRADAWSEEAQALVDPDRNWYYKRATPPDMDKVMDQHKQLVDALEAEGVEVIVAPELPRTFTKSVYARDPLLTVPGGAIIGRLAPRMRRGEEASITQAVAALGMPILGTITGTGLVEGGSFAMLRKDIALYGTSIRCNEEGARQLETMLEPLNIELIKIPLPGYTIHIDGQFMILDDKTVMANVHRLPYQFLATLEELGFEIIHPHVDEQNACNSLMVRPGRMIMASIFPNTAEMLRKRGFEVVVIDYDEIINNGGNIHCSVTELVRDWE